MVAGFHLDIKQFSNFDNLLYAYCTTCIICIVIFKPTQCAGMLLILFKKTAICICRKAQILFNMCIHGP